MQPTIMSSNATKDDIAPDESTDTMVREIFAQLTPENKEKFRNFVESLKEA